MTRSLLVSIAIAAFLVSSGSAMADAHEDTSAKGKAAAERGKSKAKARERRAGQAAEEAQADVEDARDDIEEATEDAEEAAREATDEIEEAANEAGEAMEDVAAEEAADESKREVPPGMAKRDAHPSTGKGSEKGQEARAKQEKSWWNFWD